MLTTIETPKLENTKQVAEQTQKISSLETDLKTANEKISELEKTISDKDNPELLIKGSIDYDGRIHSSLLKYFLKKNQLESNFTIGSLKLDKVFFGDGQYNCVVVL